MRGFLMAPRIKNPPAMKETQEMWARPLGQKDPLEEEMITHSSILDQKIPWSEESGRLQFKGLQSVRHSQAIKHTSTRVCGYCNRTFKLLDVHLTFIFKILAIKNNVAFSQNTRNKNYHLPFIHSMISWQNLALFWLLFYFLEFGYLIQVTPGLGCFPYII